MQTLDLDIKQRVGIDLNAIALCNQRCQTFLIFSLDGTQIGKDFIVILIFQKLLQISRITLEAVSDNIGQIIRQQRI